jgi:WD40 repeat protein
MVNGVAFSPDGKYIATASADNKASLWNATTGNPISFLRHGGAVNYVVFSPDGKYIATASVDSTARLFTAKLWISNTKGLINETSNRLTRNLTPEEWKQYMSNEPYRKTFPTLP